MHITVVFLLLLQEFFEIYLRTILQEFMFLQQFLGSNKDPLLVITILYASLWFI